MYNNDMNGDNPLDWNPYDWLITLEKMMKELQDKHNSMVRSNQQLALAYNTLSRKVADMELEIVSLKKKLKWEQNLNELSQAFSKLKDRKKR